MEREGSGYDKIYEIQLSEAKQLPIVEEKDDRVVVTIYNQIKDPNIILLIDNIKQRYQLNQKEIICLGIIAQHKNIIATEFARQIQSKDDKQIKHWLGNLLSYKIVLTKGRTKGMQYYLNPNITKDTSLGKTDLSGIEEHRLKSLLLEDIEKYPNSSIEEIHNRIGKEIPIRKLRTCLYRAVKNDELQTIGGKKYRKYFIDKNKE
jgi:ATP-dependent DNA helicase RecG